MQLRVWRAGMRGLYHPSPIVLADVTPDRMEKAYHRRWHRGNGRHCAMMRLREFVPMDVGPVTEPQDIVTLFGSPAFVHLDLVRYTYLWADAVLRRDDSFFYANQLRHVGLRQDPLCAIQGGQSAQRSHRIGDVPSLLYS